MAKKTFCTKIQKWQKTHESPTNGFFDNSPDAYARELFKPSKDS